MTYLWDWPIAITMIAFMLTVAFLGAVRIATASPNYKLAAENRHLRDAIRAFIAAQDSPPGNWDAIDRLRAAVDE